MNEQAEVTQKAPSVTAEDVAAMFESVVYIILPDGRTTIAMGTMRNGFTVRGESSCVFKENFDEMLGREYALKDMYQKAWPMAGLLLAERTHQEKTSKGATWKDRLYNEWKETSDRLEKLKAILPNTDGQISPTDLKILDEQARIMGSLVEILSLRLERARAE